MPAILTVPSAMAYTLEYRGVGMSTPRWKSYLHGVTCRHPHSNGYAMQFHKTQGVSGSYLVKKNSNKNTQIAAAQLLLPV